MNRVITFKPRNEPLRQTRDCVGDMELRKRGWGGRGGRGARGEYPESGSCGSEAADKQVCAGV